MCSPPDDLKPTAPVGYSFFGSVQSLVWLDSIYVYGLYEYVLISQQRGKFQHNLLALRHNSRRHALVLLGNGKQRYYVPYRLSPWRPDAAYG